MDKKEILKKSRKENKNQDLPELEVIKKMTTFTLIAVMLLADVILLAEHRIYGEYNIGLMTVIFSAPFIMGLYMCFKSTKKHRLPIIAGTVFFALWFGFAAFCEVTSLIDKMG
ncbi:MAG: hypothetical protein IKH78_08870 [Ruminococcus sp.]|nr:hypothetical protein [Ruminococcus sp.]